MFTSNTKLSITETNVLSVLSTEDGIDFQTIAIKSREPMTQVRNAIPRLLSLGKIKIDNNHLYTRNW